MKTFNLTDAQNGSEIVTRSGKSVRIICYDRLINGKTKCGPILALIKNNKHTFEMLGTYDLNGKNTDNVKDLDLFIK